jgi:hypothetical protein
MNAVITVMIASASAVAKVFVILAIGYISAKRPRPIPLMPPNAIDSISKLNFYLLVIPLIYATIASSVTPQKIGSAWFVLVSAIVSICIFYCISTLLNMLPFFKVENKTDFDALRISSAFVNVLALPILLFPTLCEFPIVYESFYEGGEDGSTEAERLRSCIDESNAMIFVYFFAWNLMFWLLGNPALIAAGTKRREIADAARELHLSVSSVNDDDAEATDHHIDGTEVSANSGTEDEVKQEDKQEGEMNRKMKRMTRIIQPLVFALLKTIKSPHFVALILGFITACIPPLRDQLFSSGGGLRFLGSALESLGYASASIGTLVVAASLVHEASDDVPPVVDSTELRLPSEMDSIHDRGHSSGTEHSQQHSSRNMRETMRSRRSSLSQMSIRALAAISRRKPTIRMHAWFIFSRLIVSPAIVCLIVLGMDCGGILDGIPRMAKMVVIVNSALPGAQIVILSLKAKGLSDSASIVAQVYLPSYLLSIVTLAVWTSIGLMLSREGGTSFCKT